MTKHKMKAYCPFGLQPDGLEVLIEYTYSPGRPMVRYLRNGDPGYPADPPEVDFVSVAFTTTRCDDALVLKMLEEWAIEYLASDDGFTEAVENLPDPDYDSDRADELRSERAGSGGL